MLDAVLFQDYVFGILRINLPECTGPKIYLPYSGTSFLKNDLTAIWYL